MVIYSEDNVRGRIILRHTFLLTEFKDKVVLICNILLFIVVNMLIIAKSFNNFGRYLTPL